MGIWQKMLQRIREPALDIPFAGAEPPTLGDFQASNEMFRAIVHPALKIHTFSRFAKGVGDGVQVVVAMDSALEPDGTSVIDEADTPYWDFGSSRPRMVRIAGPYSGSDLWAALYDDLNVGDQEIPLGIVSLYVPVLVFTKQRYLDVVSTTVDNFYAVRWWNLIPGP